MPRTAEALVEPEMLVWARESAGLDVEAAARKVQVKADRLASWERGEARPTVSQLRKLAKACKRPLAVFYLPAPPRDFDALRDFRRVHGAARQALSPELLYGIRQAHRRRFLAIDLVELQGLGHESDVPHIAASTPAGSAAEQLRQFLGVAVEDQVTWRSGWAEYEALNRWRDALEGCGVLVFQVRGVKVTEMRGFSVAEFPFPTIVLNISDAPNARIFTMMHELAHLAVRNGGICDLREGAPEHGGVETEVYCNHVAGAILVPQVALLQEDAVRQHRAGEPWSQPALRTLARRFAVSREVIARRLLTLGRLTAGAYQEMREQFQEEYEQYREEQHSGGFAPPDRLALAQSGRLFTRLVLSSYYQRNITASDVADFLGVRLKHVRKIEAEVWGPAFRRSG